MSTTDSDIIERSLARPAAFAELYDRHARAIHRYAARRLDSQTADDLLSETFLVAFERRATFTGTGAALPWLYGIATTLIKQHRRLEARAWRGLVAEERSRIALDAVADADARLDARRAVSCASKAIRRLSDGERDVLLLAAWTDLDYQGLAVALDVPMGTVRSRLSRARSKLRAALESGTGHRAKGRAQDREERHGRNDVPAPRAL